MAAGIIIYEYKSVTQGFTESGFNSELERQQKMGWEVMSITSGGFMAGSRKAELRRPKG